MTSSPAPLASLEGFYLFTHVSGLALQAFHMQMAQYSASQAAESADVVDLPDEASLEAFLHDGYSSFDSVSADLEAKFAQISPSVLNELVAQLPSDLPPLTQPLTGIQFRQWLIFMLEQPATAPLYQFHHMFSAGSMNDDDPGETIREAIAFDDPTLIDPSATIELEHVQMAIQACSVQVLPRLMKNFSCTEADVISLLGLAVVLGAPLPILLDNLRPTAQILERVKISHPEAASNQTILNYEASL